MKYSSNLEIFYVVFHRFLSLITKTLPLEMWTASSTSPTCRWACKWLCIKTNCLNWLRFFYRFATPPSSSGWIRVQILFVVIKRWIGTEVLRDISDKASVDQFPSNERPCRAIPWNSAVNHSLVANSAVNIYISMNVSGNSVTLVNVAPGCKCIFLFI